MTKPLFLGLSLAATFVAGEMLRPPEAEAGSVPLFTAPGGSNPANLPVALPDLNTLVNNVNANVVTTPIQPFLNSGAPRNVLVGADFGIAPWQRGTNPVSNVSNSVTYCADAFFVIGGAAGSGVDCSKATGAADIAAGFTASMKVSRHAGNSNSTPITVGQVVETGLVGAFQGKTADFSFCLQQGATFSGSAVSAIIVTGTGTDANASASNLTAGSWTGQTTAAQLTIQAAGISAVTSAFTCFSVTGAVPAAATQIGVELAWAPGSATAGATDFIEIIAPQLEIGSQPSPFERHTVQQELAAAERRFWTVSEPAATVAITGCQAKSTSQAVCAVEFPVTMRIVPTTTVVAGTFANTTQGGGAATACTIAAIGASNTVQFGGIADTCAAGSFTAGNLTLLIGGGGTGHFDFSADY